MATLSYDDAAHIYRRMGFGGSPSEIDELVSLGDRDAAVDRLINYESISNTELDTLLQQSFNFSDPQDNVSFNRGEIQRWWFTRMVNSKRQFEEKITLFWHNHFATAASKVQFQLMYNQNLALRRYALDRFDTLLERVSKDPAMLVWLDGTTNTVVSPNENFARELMELFTMGIVDVGTGNPNYTEQDIKEVARAFTGWKFRVNRQGGQINYDFFVQANQHDNTSKTVFAGTPYSRSGNLSGEDILSLVAERPETGRYLVKKLFDFFVYPLTDSATDRATATRLGAVYDNNNHSIKALVRAVFTSEEFFSARARFALVKSPIELVVSTIRMLGAKYNQGVSGRGTSSNAPANISQQMGQEAYNPPDVAGWDLNLGWVNTSTMLFRYNFANALLTNRNTTNPGIYVTNDQLKKYTKSSSKKTVKKFLGVLGPLPVGSDVTRNLRNYLETDDQGNKVGFVNNDATVDKKVRGLVHQIMCLPEFQLN